MKRLFTPLFVALMSVAVFAALPASDPFNGANDDPLSANWTVVDGALKIDTNRAAIGGAQGNAAFWNADVFADDQYSEAVIDLDDGQFTGVLVRAANYRGYLAIVSNSSTQLDIQQIDGDESYTILDTATSLSFSTGDTLRLEASGTTLTAYQNGVQRLQVLGETSYTSGSAGIFLYSTGSAGTLQSWEGGNLAAGSTCIGGLLLRGAGGC